MVESDHTRCTRRNTQGNSEDRHGTKTTGAFLLEEGVWMVPDAPLLDHRRTCGGPAAICAVGCVYVTGVVLRNCNKNPGFFWAVQSQTS